MGFDLHPQGDVSHWALGGAMTSLSLLSGRQRMFPLWQISASHIFVEISKGCKKRKFKFDSDIDDSAYASVVLSYLPLHQLRGRPQTPPAQHAAPT